MRVNFYATLRSIVGAKSVDFDLPQGATVQALLDEMIARFPALRHELLNERGEMYEHVHIFVNGRDASFLEQGMDTALQPEDMLGVFPAVGGG
jgi:molybdopterin synthase sulfur carrier subunit